MTAFILSGALAFALYELLAFAKWPPAEDGFSFRGVDIRFTEASARVALNLIRAAIVVAVLLCVLLIHQLVSPLDVISNDKVKVVFGSLFGPLLAIWVNSVVIHSPLEDLTRGQILAAIGLVLLFFIGAVGNETAAVIRQYARNLSSLKLGVAELSFGARDRNADRLGSTPIANNTTAGSAAYVSGGSQGLQYLTQLWRIIERDKDYLIQLFAPNSPDFQVNDLIQAEATAKEIINPPFSCLLGSFEQTADPGLIDKNLATFADAFGQLKTLNRQPNALAGEQRQVEERRLTELSKNFTRIGLTIALDIAGSTTEASVLKACQSLFDRYCLEMPGDGPPPLQCLSEGLKQVEAPPESSKVAKAISLLANNLRQFVDQRGLESRPYFSIGLASMMAQLGQYEAAASVLDDWLQQQRKRQREYEANPQQKIKQDWFALRARSILAAYVEEWLQKEGTKTPTVVQNEHLENLQVIRDGFKSRLMKADFFVQLEKECSRGCEPKFRRPGECTSDEQSAKLKLWRFLYTSYISMEVTYIDTALKHPDYQTKFAETANEEAQRLANFDLSCGAYNPKREVIYGQSLLVFAQNAVRYSKTRATIDSEDERTKRLDQAERAAKFGLLTFEKTTQEEDQPRAGQRYLDRIRPNLAVEVQEELKAELAEIIRVRKQLAE